MLSISVRNLVEFLLRHGDLTSSSSLKDPVEAMQLGSKIHRKIQKSMGIHYQAEVPLKVDHSFPSAVTGASFDVRIEGRADGIQRENGEILVDEIKGVYENLDQLSSPHTLHLAQALCYAYILCIQEGLTHIQVQVTYCHMESLQIRRFTTDYSREDVLSWFEDLMKKYQPWATFLHDHTVLRNKSLQDFSFPFPYRPGQQDLTHYVYQTILEEKKLFLQAPTGVGKTISNLFPSVIALREGLVQRIFYLTAKTVTTQIARDCFDLLSQQNTHLSVITITAKDKLCFSGEEGCHMEECPYAKGHYDRINQCLYDLLQNNRMIQRDTILEYAEKYQVCPYELNLDVSDFCDAVLCDYNYVFDPNVSLKRFFTDKRKKENLFLIDEAHNLVDRAREMFSAVLCKEDFLAIKKILKNAETNIPKNAYPAFMQVIRSLNNCNKKMLALKRTCENYEILLEIDGLESSLVRLFQGMKLLFSEVEHLPEQDTILNFFFDINHFLGRMDQRDENFLLYSDYSEKGDFRVHLQCMDPSTSLAQGFSKAKASILFSATLLPLKYYVGQLSIEEDDYVVYAPSSFDPQNRLVLISDHVTTVYKQRSSGMYRKIATDLCLFLDPRPGNYLFYFPSYQMLQSVQEAFSSLSSSYDFSKKEVHLLTQNPHMTEAERESFLQAFDDPKPDRYVVGFCILGGIFGEGIDLTENRLLGVAIVGTGLPMVCKELEIMRSYFQKKKGKGFDYAYLYPGMNKVLQAGGRVIRTANDRGVILLLDHRFLRSEYLNLFPKEWTQVIKVNEKGIEEALDSFWSSIE